jgi:hypothetical protein
MKKGIRGEREVGGDGVCGCSFGEPLKQVISILKKKSIGTFPNPK